MKQPYAYDGSDYVNRERWARYAASTEWDMFTIRSWKIWKFKTEKRRRRRQNTRVLCVCVCVLCCVKWVRLDQDRVQWWGLANLLMSNWIVENPLTSWPVRRHLFPKKKFVPCSYLSATQVSSLKHGVQKNMTSQVLVTKKIASTSANVSRLMLCTYVINIVYSETIKKIHKYNLEAKCKVPDSCSRRL